MYQHRVVFWSVILVGLIGTITPQLAGHDTDNGTDQTDSMTIGLYIGIGEYSDSSIQDVSVHRTNEKFLLPMLTDRFGVRWMPPVMDADATREGIRNSMLSLLGIVESAVETHSKVTVVLMFTGHGSRVKDRDGDEKDGLDETWVTVNSSQTEGYEDIVDDDIADLRFQLAELGADLVMIIESCHSESTFRGHAGLGVRSGKLPRWAPENPLFPFAQQLHYSEVKEISGFVDGTMDSDFVCLAAVQDEFPALVTEENGWQWGRFSRSLAWALKQLPRGGTYRDLHSLVVDDFSRRWPRDRQRPTLHPQNIKNSLCDEAFLESALHEPHSVFVSKEIDGDYEFSGGILEGYTKGTVVELYPSYDDYVKQQNSLGFGKVSNTSISGSSVLYEHNLPDSAVAIIHSPAVDPVGVLISSDCENDLRQSLVNRFEHSASVALKDHLSESHMVVHQLGADSVGIFSSDEIGVDKTGDIDIGVPLNVINLSGLNTTEMESVQVTRMLEFLVHTQRFWAMQGDKDTFDMRVTRYDSQEKQDTGQALLPDVDGVVSVPNEQRVVFHLKNNSESTLYAHIFFSEAGDGASWAGFEELKIKSNGEAKPIKINPGGEFTRRLTLNIDDHYNESVIRVKVVLTPKPSLPLSTILREPSGLRRGVGMGSRDDVQDPILSALTTGTRSQTGWASANFIVRVTREVAND